MFFETFVLLCIVDGWDLFLNHSADAHDWFSPPKGQSWFYAYQNVVGGFIGLAGVYFAWRGVIHRGKKIRRATLIYCSFISEITKDIYERSLMLEDPITLYNLSNVESDDTRNRYKNGRKGLSDFSKVLEVVLEPSPFGVPVFKDEVFLHLKAYEAQNLMRLKYIIDQYLACTRKFICSIETMLDSPSREDALQCSEEYAHFRALSEEIYNKCLELGTEG